MKQQYLIYGFIVVVAFTLFVWTKLKNRKLQLDTVARRPLENIIQINKVANDKLVIVEYISENHIKRILQDFCTACNEETYTAIPRLTKLSDRKFAIIFPYDVDFETYCYFINYVNYPIGFDRHFKTTGWATTKSTDAWTTEKSVNKKVMLYVSDFDTEYDNVLLTTSDNIGYKLGFAIGEEKQLLNSPEKKYVPPPVNTSELDRNKGIEFN